MSILLKASKGVIMRPQIVVLYGPNGVGKTTLACAYEQPMILDLENGSGFLSNVTRLGTDALQSFAQVREVVAALMTDKHEFKTLVIDSLESLETLIYQAVCKENKVKSIEEIPYGKGYTFAREAVEEFMHELQALRDRAQMNVVLVGHSVVKPFNDPSKNVAYDRFILRLNDKMSSVVKDLADSVFFITYRVDVHETKGQQKAKAYGSDERVVHTRWGASHDAKSRYPVANEVTFTFDQLHETVKALQPKDAGDILKDCEHLSDQIKDEAVKKKAKKSIEEAKNDPLKLETIKARLLELVR